MAKAIVAFGLRKLDVHDTQGGGTQQLGDEHGGDSVKQPSSVQTEHSEKALRAKVRVKVSCFRVRARMG